MYGVGLRLPFDYWVNRRRYLVLCALLGNTVTFVTAVVLFFSIENV